MMPPDFIPVANPGIQNAELRNEILKCLENVVDGGCYILGENTNAFEKEFADYIGVEFCVGTASGTDALILALKSVGIVPGDEVITVSHSAVATVAAIEFAGATPVFVDIDPQTRCMDPYRLELLITKKTRAILPVHIYGHPAPMQEITQIAKKYGLKVIEDCAQAHGAEIERVKVGKFGHAAAFSFYPTKNLGAIGDGGAIVTNDKDTYNQALSIREYGWQERYISSVAGMNSRLDELQASILRVKLPFLTTWNQHRMSIARRYSEVLQGKKLEGPKPLSGYTHVMHLYVVESDEREILKSHFRARNIGTAKHYPLPIHLQPAYRNRIRGSNKLKNTETLYRRILTLPMYPELNEEQINHICSAIDEWK